MNFILKFLEDMKMIIILFVKNVEIQKRRLEQMERFFKGLDKFTESLDLWVKSEAEYLEEGNRNHQINNIVLKVKDRVDSFFYKLKLCEHDYQKVEDGFLKCSKCGKITKVQGCREIFIKKILKRKNGIGTFLGKMKKKICTHDFKVISTSKDGGTEVQECTKCGKIVLKEVLY